MDIFVRGVGVGLTHTEKYLIEKIQIARDTVELEAETGKDRKKNGYRESCLVIF